MGTYVPNVGVVTDVISVIMSVMSITITICSINSTLEFTIPLSPLIANMVTW